MNHRMFERMLNFGLVVMIETGDLNCLTKFNKISFKKLFYLEKLKKFYGEAKDLKMVT